MIWISVQPNFPTQGMGPSSLLQRWPLAEKPSPLPNAIEQPTGPETESAILNFHFLLSPIWKHCQEKRAFFDYGYDQK
jgi:hypothetical protein